MMEFHDLKIASIEYTTEDCVIVELEVPQTLKENFTFIQGQYLNLQAYINGEQTRRSYSLCSSPLDENVKVAIKKVPEGKFSTYANEILKVGDIISASTPDGKFYTPVNPESNSQYICFAAGSGITPIVSIIKTHLSLEPKASFKLFFVNKTASSIILKEALDSLKNQFMNRLEIFYFLTKEHRNVPLLNGRLDEEKLTFVFDKIIQKEASNHYFICGPEKMIFGVRDFLLAQDIDKSSIHFELFNTSGEAVKAKKAVLAKKLAGKYCEVTIKEGGKELHFELEQGKLSVLDAALNNAADLPFACKGGVCCTCRAKLIEGEVNMPVHYGLEDDEIEDGYILTCQAIPTSEKIVVDFDV